MAQPNRSRFTLFLALVGLAASVSIAPPPVPDARLLAGARANLRMRELLNASDDLRKIEEEWERRWPVERVEGVIQ